MFDLREKIAVITGAGSGLGLSIAERFASAGASVVIADVTNQHALADRLGGVHVETDVSSEQSVENLVAVTVERFGRVDILVNNAGIIIGEDPLTLESAANFERTFAVNTLGVVFGIKHAAQHMPPGGAIINTASTAGLWGVNRYGAYVASKWAVVGITKTAAIELGPQGIRVNCICPGTVRTQMSDYFAGAKLEMEIFSLSSTLGRIAKPDDIAALAHFLASDDCSSITGQAIVVDAGVMAGHSVGLRHQLEKGLALGAASHT